MYAYDPSQVWNQSVWTLLGIAGGVVFSLFLLGWIRDIAGDIRSKPWRNPDAQDTAFVPLALAGMTAAVVVVATPFLFDRYGLGVLPMLMIPALRRMSNIGVDPIGRRAKSGPEHLDRRECDSRKSWELGLALGGAAVPIAAFSLVAIRDYKEHATVRWQAAEKSKSPRG